MRIWKDFSGYHPFQYYFKAKMLNFEVFCGGLPKKEKDAPQQEILRLSVCLLWSSNEIGVLLQTFPRYTRVRTQCVGKTYVDL